MKEKPSIYKEMFRKTRWEAAKRWLELHPNVDIVGITGSVGKTTVKEIVAAILAKQFPVIRSSANYDPIFNIPLTVLKVRDGEKLVLEMGVDEPGQMEKYLTLIDPRIAIVTRFSPAHTDVDHFGSLEGLISEKSKLVARLPFCGWAVLNGDDDNVQSLAGRTKATALLYGYGDACDLRVSNFSQKLSGNEVLTQFKLDYGFGGITFKTRLLGKHQALSATAGIAVGMIMGLDFDQIQAGLLDVYPYPGRLEVKRHRWGGVLIDDSYNASPEAVKSAIDVLNDLDPENNVLILGDMLELGDFSVSLHREIGEYAARNNIRYLLVIGSYSSDVIEGFVGSGGKIDNVFKAVDHNEIITWLEMHVGEKSRTILVKGSHGMHMEKVVDAIVD
jgi:UDP-N-acetylmuramoyl-tripeptide--D-alanyl-D-alanine ligase